MVFLNYTNHKQVSSLSQQRISFWETSAEMVKIKGDKSTMGEKKSAFFNEMKI